MTHDEVATLAPGLLSACEAPIMLVACDFDGTLSPIAPTPDEARADPEAISALAALSRLAGTYAAVVSGRSLEALRRLTGSPRGVWLVGSHGAEPDDAEAPVPGIDAGTRGELQALLYRIADATPGGLVEEKPGGMALHVRRCEASAARRALDQAREAAACIAGLHMLEGDRVLELSWWSPDKYAALQRLRRRSAATAVVFIGDDTTDEHAFARMSLVGGEVAVRVGPGETSAGVRVGDQARVGALLRAIGAARGRWLAAHRPVPIERHSLLSDQRTMSLVDDRGRVVWLCLPRADSGAVFAELLGGPEAGFFAVEPAVDPGPAVQSYAGDTMVLRTRWSNVSVTDYLDCAGGRAYQRAGRSDLVRVLEGTGRVRVTLAPRFDFGRRQTTITPRPDGLEIEAGADALALHAPGIRWSIRHESGSDTAEAEIELSGEPVVLELRSGIPNLVASRTPEASRREQTLKFWSGWSSALRPPTLARAQAVRSALLLKALCYGPTGAIHAAATTSLPEQPGGERNWDYRFCWPRDACLAASALTRLGNTGVAMKLLDWLVGVVESVDVPEHLRPIYTVTGDELWPEAEIGALRGYAASRPVRIGNAADHQVQLDVFGPIVDLVAMVAEAGLPVTPEHWRLVQAMVSAVAARWNEPDHGIWEIRGPKRHHVHSRTMCWLAASRGAMVAELVTGKPRPEWAALAETIRTDVLEHGYSAERGAFVIAYGSRALDAAALWVVLSGMIAPDDPRAVSTVRAVQRELLEGAGVYRYREDDGLAGEEGAFVITSFWLAEALWLIGDRTSAVELFNRAADLAGPTGLIAEQCDPRRGLALGNIPQAYSHLGLINAAMRLSGS